MKKIRKIVVMIIMIVMLINLHTLVQADTITQYVALGDSIAEGYGLSNKEEQSYVAQVAKSLNTQVKNYAVVGMNSTEFLQFISNEENQTNIKQADLITISIGSNDLLGVVTQVIGEAFEVDVQNATDLLQEVTKNFLEASLTKKTEMIKSLYTSLSSTKTQQKLSQGVDTYRQNWPQIVKQIKQMNEASQIIVTEFYNPYYGVEIPLMDENTQKEISFTDYVAIYIEQLNEILHSNENLGYSIAPIYDTFNQKGMTNASLEVSDNFSVDPHPNTKGHTAIADSIKQVLNVQDPTPIKIDINNCEISKVSQQIYTGKEIKPNVTVTYQNKTLKKDTDYTVQYSNHTKVGIANIKIEGIGDYTGSKEITFKIVEEEEKKEENNMTNPTNGSSTSNTSKPNNSTKQDGTIATMKLPYTGIMTGALLAIAIVTLLAILFALKSRSLEDITKIK